MKRLTIVVFLLAAAACLLWVAVAQMPDGRLHVFFLDVESGQAILVRTPSGRVALIDGGPEASALLGAMGRYLPFWQRTIYAVLATHQGANAVLPLLEVCRRYDTVNVLGPAAGDRPSAVYTQWRAVLEQRKTTFSEAQPGTVIDLANGVVIEVTGTRANQMSLRLSYGGTSVFLPGHQPAASVVLDGTVVAFPASPNSPPHVDVAAGVNAVVLLSGKRGGVAYLPEWPGVQIFSTASDGTIELVSDGHGIQLRRAQ